MKTKLKRNISTGLAVRTTLKAGEGYVPCGCDLIPDVDPSVGLYCDDSKGKGNNKNVYGYDNVRIWMDTYCPEPEDMLLHPMK